MKGSLFALLALAADTALATSDQINFGSDEFNEFNAFQLAVANNGGVENLGLDDKTLNLLAEAWNSAYERDPALVKSKLQPQSAAVDSRPPPIKVSKKEGFTVHTLDSFPNFALRVKDPGAELNIDDVQQYTGYVDILDEDKHFFFWLFESRNDPKKDPFVMWLNGGPGCSSSTGLFFELGPSFVNGNLTLDRNPNSWNNNATVLFLDQPVNVGYSYSSNRVTNTKMAAEDVYSFLEVLFSAFPQYKSLPFHISGESYGGKYLPAVGAAILDHPERSFDLSSVIIGNPITDVSVQAFSSVAMACGDGGYPSVLDEETCSDLYKKVPHCVSLVNACYDSNNNYLICQGASMYCLQLELPYLETGRNPYDISDICYDECYPETGYIQDYLRRPDVIKAVGSDVDDFVDCDNKVGSDFQLSADGVKNEGPDVLKILENGVDMLFYDGNLDWICSWPGVYQLVERLRYKNHSEFTAKPLTQWYVDGVAAGETKSAGHLSWMKVYGAGHMVPHNKGVVASNMINQWLQHREFTSS